MTRRVIDTGIALCGLVVCVLISGLGDALAAPGDCDKLCREVLVVAADQPPPAARACTKFKYADCNVCELSGGCDNNLPAKGGSCKITTTDQEDCRPSPCTILCKNPVVSTTYEGHTNDPIANYKVNGKVFLCNTKTGN